MSILSGITKTFASSGFGRRDGSQNTNIQMSPTSIFMDGMAISLSMFSISAMCFVKYIIQQQRRRSPLENVPFYQRRRKSLHDLRIGIHTTNEGAHHDRSNADTEAKNHDSTMMAMISNRGKTALLPVIPYQQQFFAALSVRGSSTTFC